MTQTHPDGSTIGEHVEGSGSEQSFAHPESARRLRDAIDKVVMDRLNRDRPQDQYGVVTAIDADGRHVWVDINGSGQAIPVHVGAIQPKLVGQRVRIATVRPGDMVVVDVYGTSVLTSETQSELPDVTGLVVGAGINSLIIDWDQVGAPNYEVEVAEDAGFTTGLRGPWITQATTFTVSGLLSSTTYYVRVRSVNGAQTAADDFYATGSGTPLTAPGGSDGSPPDSPSPQPTVVAGIGMVSATWADATGTTDTVTYEVHVSTTSGFTPSAATLLSETTSTFANINILPDNTPLTSLYGTNVFVRIIAKDDDGTASVSSQGFAAPQQVELGDVGSIPIDNLSDGSAPSTSPTPTAQPGLGYVYLKWDHVTNDDPVEYEIHMSSLASFTPVSNTLIGVTPSNWFFARKLSTQAAGTIGNTNDGGVGTNDSGYEVGSDILPWGVVYYFKIVATDADGSASPGGEVSSASLRLNNDAIETAAINEAVIADAAITRGKILDAAIDTAKIADLSVTNAKIGYLAVGRANIQSAAISSAQIDDLAVTTAKIADLAVTNAKIDTIEATKITAGTIGAHTIILGGASSILQSSTWSTSAGWRILGDGSIDVGGTDPSSWHVDNAGNMWWGNGGSYSGSPGKRISNAGAIDFDTGTFGGSVAIGSGNNILKIDSSGDLYGGNTSSANAPFFVDVSTGFIYASDLYLRDVGSAPSLNLTDNTIMNVEEGSSIRVQSNLTNRWAYIGETTKFGNGGREGAAFYHPNATTATLGAHGGIMAQADLDYGVNMEDSNETYISSGRVYASTAGTESDESHIKLVSLSDALTNSGSSRILYSATGYHDFQNGPVRFINGSAASPGLAFRTDIDTGFYKYADGAIGISVAGSYRGRFEANIFEWGNEIHVSDGSGTDPSYTFINDVDVGLFLNSTGNLGISAGGHAATFANASLGLRNDPGVGSGGTLYDAKLRTGSINSETHYIIRRDTSSLRFKKDVTPLEIGEDDWLKVKPIQFRRIPKDDGTDDWQERDSTMYEWAWAFEEVQQAWGPIPVGYSEGDQGGILSAAMAAANHAQLRRVTQRTIDMEARLSALEAAA